MAARQITGKKPKNFWFTFRTLLAYMGRHKFLFLAVAVLVTISALGNLLGTYMIRPVVNSVGAGDVDALARGVLATAAICGVGALAAFGYTQTMVYAAQQVLYDIRRDLFAHIQSLPLRFFDTQLHGDIMSYFTNDVDTVADALNNSFAMTIQSFIQLAGTLVLLFILNWQLSLIVVVGYAAMFLYIRFSAKRSTSYYTTQQAALGDVNGYIEEMVSGQKVVKVFNHEPANLRVFQAKNEALRQAGTGAQSYAATMVPAVVSISYINYAIVAVVGGLMALRGMTDIGSLSSYLVFVRQAAMPINQFTQQSNFLLAAMAGAERIFEAMRLPPEVDEGRIRLVNTRGEGVTLTACAEKTGRWAWQKPDGSLVPLRGDVRFHDVTFGYEKGRPILQNITSPTTASTCGTSPRTRCGSRWASCCRTPTCSPAPLPTTSASASWTPPGRRSSARPGSPTPTVSSGACPRATTPASPRTAPACPRASGSCWPSPGRRWPTRRC